MVMPGASFLDASLRRRVGAAGVLNGMIGVIGCCRALGLEETTHWELQQWTGAGWEAVRSELVLC